MADYPTKQWAIENGLLKEAPGSAHYQQLSPEPIDVIELWNLDFHLGNVVKYIARSKYKGNEKQDLEKALWYLKRKLDEIQSDYDYPYSR
jgi:hypothetical protein